MSNVRKTALIITALTLGSKFLGFMREIALAYFYGTSYVIDAYVMAVAIPGIVFGWIASLAVSYTPIYMDAKVKLGANKSIRFTDNMISIGITISIFCVLIGVIFSSKLVSI
ncbi:MAG: murein biosynthesis integral membrane protein MurJ, partial [Tissierellia bacterium]|nr:murein biosynthesis integral membrane protein MurJ [Tissierellia bacterium]